MKRQSDFSKLSFGLDFEIGGIVLVLVLDPWGFGAEKRARSSAIILFHHFHRKICRILEDEHDF